MKKDRLFEILQYLGSLLLCASYPSQIYKTYFIKSVNDMSLGFWIPLTIDLFLIDCNAYHIWKTTNRKAFFIGQTFNVLFALIVVCQILIYR